MVSNGWKCTASLLCSMTIDTHFVFLSVFVNCRKIPKLVVQLCGAVPWLALCPVKDVKLDFYEGTVVNSCLIIMEYNDSFENFPLLWCNLFMQQCFILVSALLYLFILSVNFYSRNILEDKPNDQASRWSSDSNNPPQVRHSSSCNIHVFQT